MNLSSRAFAAFVLLTGLLSAMPAKAQDAAAEQDLFQRAPWSFSTVLGGMRVEGDEEVDDGPYVAFKLGYDFDPRWALEGAFMYFPELPARDFDNPERYSIDEDISAMRLGADVLFHLRNTKNLRFDPYLAAGAGIFFWEEDLGSGKEEFSVTAGLGTFYHFTEAWAARLDVRSDLVGGDVEGKLYGNIGFAYRWGTKIPSTYVVTGGGIDSDGDGLLDTEEKEIGTDPYDPDTDKDGLSDGEEVKVYYTNPLNPDSDMDGLKDGAEVLAYKTNPLDVDTDDGGVADGHEVIEDFTDPLNPNDDLLLFTLNIEFDYDKSIIRTHDYEELDAIMKVMQRDPGATASIEGHADKRKTSKRSYNQALSERRAKAVKDYIVKNAGVEPSRIETKGFSFDRPLVPNTTEENMQKNRRTEVYIRRSGATGVKERKFLGSEHEQKDYYSPTADEPSAEIYRNSAVDEDLIK